MTAAKKATDLIILLETIKQDITNATNAPSDVAYWLAVVENTDKFSDLVQDWQDSPEFSE